MNATSNSAVKQKFDCSRLRYAQCWEDADVLVEAARISNSDKVLSICSAGDNTLALLAQNPQSVVALDMSTAQLAALELRVAAFSALSYEDTLHLLGHTQNLSARKELYRQIRERLSSESRRYWDENERQIETGVSEAGKFEAYFRLFRNAALPLIHTKSTIDRLLESKTLPERIEFFDRIWNSKSWRALCHLFFSRRVMGCLGRDRAFFNHVEDNVDLGGTILEKTKFALTQLAPAENPYLHWILKGNFNHAMPVYLRPENFQKIRGNLHKLSWRQCSMESYLSSASERFDVFNLSDIFEYMSEPDYVTVLGTLLARSNKHARLIYWNMLVDRQSPNSFSSRITKNVDLATRLFAVNKTFFYKRLVIEESLC